jgi:hypothetical protein
MKVLDKQMRYYHITNAYLRHALHLAIFTPAETRYARSTGLTTDLPLSGHRYVSSLNCRHRAANALFIVPYRGIIGLLLVC